MANNADAIDLMNENTRLVAEVERLKAQIKGRTLVPELEEKHRELLRERAKIEAALAHHQPKAKGSAVCQCGDRWYDGRCHSPTVKALTGGREK